MQGCLVTLSTEGDHCLSKVANSHVGFENATGSLQVPLVCWGLARLVREAIIQNSVVDDMISDLQIVPFVLGSLQIYSIHNIITI